MTPSEFAAKWKGCQRSERAAAQEHFCDLCRMLGVDTPNDADPTGEWYAFEKGTTKQGGGEGFADVWKRDHFAWEYKRKKKNLNEAYDQLLLYREALGNPPLLVVCDLHRFEVRTNFTATMTELHAFDLDDFTSAATEPMRVLRAVLQEPEALRPKQTRAQVTEEAAARFADLATKLQARGHEPQVVAHFLNRLLFCFFAEDIGVLPRGLLPRLIEATRTTPNKFTEQLGALFAVLTSKGKGYFGTDKVQWINGGLFDNANVLPLESDDLSILLSAAKLDWSNIEPAILGTLFERGLDPSKRSQFGAHYTDKESILRIVEPVVLAPLRRDFEVTKKLASSVSSRVTGAFRSDSPRKRGRSRFPTVVPNFRAPFLVDRRTVAPRRACGATDPGVRYHTGRSTGFESPSFLDDSALSAGITREVTLGSLPSGRVELSI
jgi:hypothetical protein